MATSSTSSATRPPSRLLAIPPELRNAIYEHLMSPSSTPEQYTTFGQAISQQPPLAHTCQQLRKEIQSMYFADMRLVISIRKPEVFKFKSWLESSDESLVAAIGRLSLEMPCCGTPELSHEYRAIPPHSMLFDIQWLEDGRWEVVERHGIWWKRGDEWVFKAMAQKDSFGCQTCSMFAVISVDSLVVDWRKQRLAKGEVQELIKKLCAHPKVAPRLQPRID